MNYPPSHQEVLTQSQKELRLKFAKLEETETFREVFEYYTHVQFPKFPPIPYLFVFNDAFFGFLHNINSSELGLRAVMEWLKSPPFEQGMAAHAKLPEKPYLSGFHPFAFQHNSPDHIDLSAIKETQSMLDSKATARMCEEFKQEFKTRNGLHNQKVEHCKQCKVGVMSSYEERSTLGADEAAKPVSKCVSCGYKIKHAS